MKYLLILVLLVVVWSVLKKRRGAPPRDAASRPDPAPEKMLVCAHCGVHMPESDALVGAGKVYCCEAHRSAAAKSG